MTTTHRRFSGWPAFAAALGLALPAFSQTPPDSDGEVWRYRIAAGDTLISLSHDYLDRAHGWQSLQQLNQVQDPLRLVPGSSLKIPVAWLNKTATVAEVVFVQGDASAQADAASTAQPLLAGASLQAGSLIRTEPEASATLRFADGSRLLIVGDSRVTLERLLVYGRSGLPSIKLRLEQGGADSKVVPNTGRTRGYEIRTPAVNLGVRGTEFRTQVGADGSNTRVEVLQGKVGAGTKSNGAAETAVPAGFGSATQLGAAVSAPQPLLGAPDLGGVPARLERVPLRMSWPALPGATGYRAQVMAASDAGEAERLLLDGRFTEPAARWADLPDGRYELRVRGIDPRALEGVDGVLRFELKARPEPPFTTTPPADGKVYGPKASFGWSRSAAAASYRLQVASTADFANPLLDRSGLTDDRLALDLAPGVYYWRLASVTASGDQGPFGDPQSFAQRELPPDPAVEPPQPTPDGVMLRWRAPEAGRQVQFQVATDAAFEHIVIDQKTEAGEALLPHPEPGSYYLRARSIDADGFAGEFGGVQQIEVPTQPPSKWWLLVPASVLWFVL